MVNTYVFTFKNKPLIHYKPFHGTYEQAVQRAMQIGYTLGVWVGIQLV
jgi:hypothetical protein